MKTRNAPRNWKRKRNAEKRGRLARRRREHEEMRAAIRLIPRLGRLATHIGRALAKMANTILQMPSVDVQILRPSLMLQEQAAQAAIIKAKIHRASLDYLASPHKPFVGMEVHMHGHPLPVEDTDDPKG